MEKQIFRTRSVLQSSKSDIEGVGTLRWVGSNLYRWVRNYHTSAMTAGMVCYHPSTSPENFTKRVYEGDASDATYNIGFMAGVIASTTIAADSSGSANDGGFGWVQVYGYNAGISMNASLGGTDPTGTGLLIGLNDVLCGSSGETYVFHNITAPSWGRHIVALEAVATSYLAGTLRKGFIHCT